MATTTINGVTYSGTNVSIVNNKIYIDGKEINCFEKDTNKTEISIVITGDLQSLNVDACKEIIVNGNTGQIKTVSGDVDVSGNVNGNVSTMSGNVNCNNVQGNISTMNGNVKYKK